MRVLEGLRREGLREGWSQGGRGGLREGGMVSEREGWSQGGRESLRERKSRKETCFLPRLASLEAGERDASEFIRWQEEMKQVATPTTTPPLDSHHM